MLLPNGQQFVFVILYNLVFKIASHVCNSYQYAVIFILQKLLNIILILQSILEAIWVTFLSLKII